MSDLIIPAIVIPCYKRADALKNLCTGLLNAEYPEGIRIPLVFAVDFCEKSKVPDFVAQFEWPYGEKIVIAHPTNLGLKKNILLCGDLSATYGAVIVLEDDLLVSKTFYRYALLAINFYNSSTMISGISLYSYSLNELVNLPFHPITENCDVHFIGFPSSWGQAWTHRQWQRFRRYYDSAPELKEVKLPAQVKSWKETSWKKYFCAFLIESQTYFVYPNQSQTTNFSDFAGTHHFKGTGIYQTPIQNKKDWKFENVEKQTIKYDAFFELAPEAFVRTGLEPFINSLTIDLHGVKLRSFKIAGIDSEYILTKTSYVTGKPILTFGMKLKPPENNIIYHIPGTQIGLYRTDGLTTAQSGLHFYENDYYTPFITLPDLIKTSSRKVISKLKRKISLPY